MIFYSVFIMPLFSETSTSPDFYTSTRILWSYELCRQPVGKVFICTLIHPKLLQYLFLFGCKLISQVIPVIWQFCNSQILQCPDYPWYCKLTILDLYSSFVLLWMLFLKISATKDMNIWLSSSCWLCTLNTFSIASLFLYTSSASLYTISTSPILNSLTMYSFS